MKKKRIEAKKMPERKTIQPPPAPPKPLTSEKTTKPPPEFVVADIEAGKKKEVETSNADNTASSSQVRSIRRFRTTRTTISTTSEERSRQYGGKNWNSNIIQEDKN